MMRLRKMLVSRAPRSLPPPSGLLSPTCLQLSPVTLRSTSSPLVLRIPPSLPNPILQTQSKVLVILCLAQATILSSSSHLTSRIPTPVPWQGRRPWLWPPNLQPGLSQVSPPCPTCPKPGRWGIFYADSVLPLQVPNRSPLALPAPSKLPTMSLFIGIKTNKCSNSYE